MSCGLPGWRQLNPKNWVKLPQLADSFEQTKVFRPDAALTCHSRQLALRAYDVAQHGASPQNCGSGAPAAREKFSPSPDFWDFGVFTLVIETLNPRSGLSR